MSAVFAMLACCISGSLLTYLYDDSGPLSVRVASGACLGITLAFVAGLGVAAIAGFGLLPSCATVMLAVAPLALVSLPRIQASIREDISAARAYLRFERRAATVALSLFAAAATVLIAVFASTMYESGEGVFTAFVNNIGDLPFHLKVITAFAYGNNFPPEHPLFAGVRFAYPFAADLATAIFVPFAGALSRVMFAQNLVLALATVVLLSRWTCEIVEDRVAGLLAPALLIFSGGLGWWMYARDLAAAGALAGPARDYTIQPNGLLRWGNAMTTLFVPQRSLLLAVPLALCIFREFWTAFDPEKSARGEPFRRLVAAGLMTGCLPLVHAHTFAVVLLVAVGVAVFARAYRPWVAYFSCAAALAAPQALWILSAGAVSRAGFLGWSLGWDHGTYGIAWFWFVNTGLFIPLLAVGLLLRYNGTYLAPARTLKFYAPFALCFLIPNVLRLAPWIWDNIKVLFYWYLGSIPIVARVLSFLLARGFPARALAVVLLAALTASGALDLWRASARVVAYREFDPDGVRIAEAIRSSTSPSSLVLHAPAYNSPALLAGRRTLLGYTGILWSHGLSYERRERDVRAILSGSAEAPELLARYGVQYVLIGPEERAFAPVNAEFFSRFTTAAEFGAYTLYVVPEAR